MYGYAKLKYKIEKYYFNLEIFFVLYTIFQL